jgi:CRISPR-associated endonuclease/helicase Cas3
MSGAMVGVICNTVHDDQLLYSLLKTETDICINLFHARYTFSDRMRIENKTLSKYGKIAIRNGGLLIATQVIEQSLDLNFSPIEFLMQRMGQLWRHNHEVGSGLVPRSKVITQPLFITLCPDLRHVENNWEIRIYW